MKAGRHQVSVHWNKTCYIVDNVEVLVPTHGRLKKTQPRFVMAGKARSFRIADGNIGVLA